MIHWSIFLVVVLFLLVVNYYVFGLGKKKGISDFLNMLFIAGLMGKTEAFRNYNKYSTPGGIAFVGDSITQDFNVYEYFPDKNVYNRGIGGDTSKGVLGRLEESVFGLKPKKVFLNIGTNDLELLDDGIEGIFARVKEIVQKIKDFDQNMEIFIISVYPVNPKVDKMTVGKRSNQEIKRLNDLLKTIENIEYIDIFTKLLSDDGNLAKEYTIEGLHMNQNGYEVIKAELINHID